MNDSKEEKLEPGDFYFNADGLMVLTKAYLLSRGFCCEKGCLHCPYKKQEEKPSSDPDYKRRG